MSSSWMTTIAEDMTLDMVEDSTELKGGVGEILRCRVLEEPIAGWRLE
jgi:hypothetical protein